MTTDKVKQLTDKLLEKTIANQVVWNRSSGFDGFQLILNSGSLSIDNYYNEDSRQHEISISLYNEDGVTIESITYGNKDDKEDFKYYENFYKTVKRKYLKVDETIDSFFKEINTDGKVGNVIKDNDDLPF